MFLIMLEMKTKRIGGKNVQVVFIWFNRVAAVYHINQFVRTIYWRQLYLQSDRLEVLDLINICNIHVHNFGIVSSDQMDRWLLAHHHGVLKGTSRLLHWRLLHLWTT